MEKSYYFLSDSTQKIYYQGIYLQQRCKTKKARFPSDVDQGIYIKPVMEHQSGLTKGMAIVWKYSDFFFVNSCNVGIRNQSNIS